MSNTGKESDETRHLLNPRNGEPVRKSEVEPGEVYEYGGDCAVIGSSGNIRIMAEGFVPPIFRLSTPAENEHE